jgi:hypothetical protein
MKSLARILFCCALLAAPGLAEPAVAEGKDADWKYWTGEGSVPAGWQTPEFDDKAWNSGRAPLGLGEARLKTTVKPADHGGSPSVALFRKSFTLPKLEKGARVVVSLCVDDGAVLFVNGRELKRLNLPEGPLKPETKAVRQLSDSEEGFYTRWTIPNDVLKPEGGNLIAAEVHQAGERSSDLFFDLAVRTVTPRGENPKADAAALAVIDAYYKGQHVAPGMTIPDGYIDGGRNMKFDAEGRATSNREIIVVDRARDLELKKHLEFARAPQHQQLTPRERAVRIAKYVDEIATPVGGPQWTEPAITQLTDEFTNQPVLMGEILDQCQAGVCRHRALLFKILADEAGLKAALRRGNLQLRRSPKGYPHAWNEVYLEDGGRLLVDTSYRAGKWDFPDVKTPSVVEQYRRLDDSPLYGEEAKEPR